MRGIQVVKAGLSEASTPQEHPVRRPFTGSSGSHIEEADHRTFPFMENSEDILYEFELEDMCEQDPASWEHLACQKWEESQSYPGETRDSVTGETLDPT